MYETDPFIINDKQTNQACNKKLIFIYAFLFTIIGIAIIFAICNLVDNRSTNKFIITSASNITANSALIHIRSKIRQSEKLDLCYIEKYDFKMKSFTYDAFSGRNIDVQLDDLHSNKTYLVYISDDAGVVSNFFWITTLF